MATGQRTISELADPLSSASSRMPDSDDLALRRGLLSAAIDVNRIQWTGAVYVDDGLGPVRLHELAVAVPLQTLNSLKNGPMFGGGKRRFNGPFDFLPQPVLRLFNSLLDRMLVAGVKNRNYIWPLFATIVPSPLAGHLR